MKKVDQRCKGVGLTIRQVRDVLNSVPEKDLDQGFVVKGVKAGYDFLSFVGPAPESLRIGTVDNNVALVAKGKLIAILQDEDVG